MALTEDEEFELLSLEREKSMISRKPKFSSIAEANAAMSQARKEQAAAEYSASPLGFADVQIGRFIKPLTQNILGAAESITGGLSGKIPVYQQMADRQGAAFNIGRAAGTIPVGMAASKALASQLPRVGPFMQNVLSGAVTGAYTMPENRAVGAVGGAAVGGVGAGAAKVARGLGDAIRMLPTRISGYRGTDRSADFASKIREAYVGVKADAVKKFGAGLDDLVKANPDKKINLFDEGDIGSILTDPNLPSEASNVFKRTPILRDIISGKRGPEVTVTEAQEIINYIGAKVPRTIKANTMDIPELVSELRAAQASKFPEMSKLREEYARVANPYRDLKSQMRFNNILKSIDQNFGGSEGMKSLRVLFKDNPELLRKMGGYKKAETLLKGAAVAGAYAVGKTALDAVSGSIGMANK